MKRVLVTGASGFIGRQVVRQLTERGYQVHALGRTGPPASADESGSAVRWHACDLLSTSPQELADLLAPLRASHWIHLAWCTEPGTYWRSPQNLQWLTASLALLRAFRDHGGERVVMAGTCAEYDWAYGYCREGFTPLRPTTPYGSAKHALQVLLDAFHATSGLSSAWGRIFFLYGPGERAERLVPSVIRPLLAGAVAPCTKGDQIRDYLHIDDAASAFVTLLESDHQGPANVASGVPLRVKDLAGLIAAQIGRPDLLKLGALPSREEEPLLLVADCAVLHRLQWKPRFDIDAGIAQTIAWWRSGAG